MKLKYLIIKHSGLEAPLIFAPILRHEIVAGNSNVQSAGFCNCDETGKWTVSGESVSLKLSARPEDAEILNTLLA
ncbi:MAG TPA: hypothetical protein VGO57_04385 [Verrucomicrobiae bacterium]|jgi:hypothetical protein